ncbi:ribosomal protein S18 acetylase RimI-like enzyme [Algoriphagus sp. 4150]|uniref:GNAT family N-acetyltransferase n=1 Tax=Algoriphagus sp. 4150 TaxID=2817756 RepID=UPI00285E2113|nr:GNAT family N-acetyltransferase [Algoriphagus sp. 4150]MDR7128957.1 ribosomal protein S18 acetylase RimI-like enzyme [Algoriphagus sp. 4150]
MNNTVKEKNISNLISLWETVGNSFQKQFSQNTINYCQVSGSEWPNRVWFTAGVTEETLETAAEIIWSSSIPLTLSHWSDFENELHPIFEQFRFGKKSEQIGMSLKLHGKYTHSDRITLQRVTEESQATSWSALYPRSFGYQISPEILNKTNHLISYYLVRFNDQIIGTVIAHKTENVLGVHGLGIIPEFRKQGLAEEVMAHLINNAIDDHVEFVTLQSSAMGKGIYQKMGFSEDFLMTNYGLLTTP